MRAFLLLVAAAVAVRKPLRTVVEHEGKLVMSGIQTGMHAEATAHTVAPMFIISSGLGFNLTGFDPKKGMSVVYNAEKRTLEMVGGIGMSNAFAWGSFVDNIEKTGWAELYVSTTESTTVSEDLKMYAAGFVEGIMTAYRTSQFYSNVIQTLMKDSVNSNGLANTRIMFGDEIAFLEKNANIHPGVLSVPPPDPYWAHARYVMTQIWGFKDAYNEIAMATQGGPASAAMLDMVDMWTINSHAELSELLLAYSPERLQARQKFQAAQQGETLLQANPRPAAKRLRRMPASSGLEAKLNEMNASVFMHLDANDTVGVVRDWANRLKKRGHCSALVKVVNKDEDIFVGHTTWDDYAKMTRIFKYYNFQLPTAYTYATHIGMSSYPGCISSTDDYYIMNSGLVVTDTTLEILNPLLYNRVPDFPVNVKVPNFVHIMAVNRMARTAAQWTSVFSERTSGTGNAQWMVVDYNNFKPGMDVPDNSFHVLETVPGVVQKADMSGQLRLNGFWASYNRPFFDRVRQESGHSAAEATFGLLYSYGANPRANIFSRLQGTIRTLLDMRLTMRRNKYPNEPIEPNSPAHAIAGRFDLDGQSPVPNGAIDSKIVSRCLLQHLSSQTISGPPTDAPLNAEAEEVPRVFTWQNKEGKEMFPGWPHLGLPNRWDFPWVMQTPTLGLGTMTDDCRSPGR
mmetsp:Transcript_36647/g.80039  ORF Transcript_36647/g.80039 Transcript_36647/m.80039 type:complete len:682 (+) Transcript_36647:164-2209(+)